MAILVFILLLFIEFVLAFLKKIGKNRIRIVLISRLKDRPQDTTHFYIALSAFENRTCKMFRVGYRNILRDTLHEGVREVRGTVVDIDKV